MEAEVREDQEDTETQAEMGPIPAEADILDTLMMMEVTRAILREKDNK